MAPDQRFARLTTDPRFRRAKQKNVKAEIDERFKDVLTEDFGKVQGTSRVDSRGRKRTSTHTTDEMKRFYRMRSPEAGEEPAPRIDYARGEGLLESSGSEDEDSSEDDESDVEEDELEIGGKRSRLAAFQPSDSESEEDSDDEGQLKVDLSEDEDESAFPPEADDEEEQEEEEGIDPTARIAAVNLDWDHLRAGDIFTIFASFLKPVQKKGDKSAPPPPGKLLNVRIYPSEFGKERMAKEDELGPGGGIFLAKPGDKKKSKGGKRTQKLSLAQPEEEEDEEEEEEGAEEEEDEEDDAEEDAESEIDGNESDGLDADADDLEIISDVASEAGSEDIDMEQLRQYQLERLRYYYAIATFSTVAAAELIMGELNGTEFERTANVLDLAYVPEDMTFAEDEATDECDKEPKGYKGNEFVTDALRHSKVKLTWDQDDANRTKLTRRALTREEIEEEDFANLVAGSDSEDDDADFEEDEEAGEKKMTKKQKMKERKEKLRALLLGGDDDETGDIWGKAGSAWQDELADLKEDKASKGKKGKKGDDDVEITFRPGLSVAKAAEPETDDMTTLEKYQRRMKEKKAKKKEELELKRAEKEGRDGKKVERKAADDFFGDDDSGAEDEPAVGKARSPDPEDLGLVDDPTHHFSLKDHLAAEKDAGKKKRKRNKKKAAREVELGPEGFKVDVADPRFSAMYDEASFALDPTHPKFHDSAANREILKKTREGHAAKRDAPGTAGGAASGERDLAELAASVKRKMEGGSSRKRKRSKK
ncbi:Pre-rRNA-processing protein esf1 [Vanrija pseudolonga]|uniref:Pre-rRNA-processing protein esf1 n=1 Tax=Vanrija pseudolonga TaxID=143232 RepID=A0AAF0XZ28_9TREE|nr:Pre-rRNA-processing protein esf1 [Vanrija pseudolonga]